MVIEPLVMGLLLAAALMHATWNALLKSDRSDRLATFGVIMATGMVMGLCAVPFLPWIEPGAWKYMVASVAIHLAYYAFLLKAYSYGDLSHTYPIARGLGPLLVAAASGRLIGEHLRGQVAGDNWFPVLMRADEDTRVGDIPVRVRVTVKYADYKAR